MIEQATLPSISPSRKAHLAGVCNMAFLVGHRLVGDPLLAPAARLRPGVLVEFGGLASATLKVEIRTFPNPFSLIVVRSAICSSGCRGFRFILLVHKGSQPCRYFQPLLRRKRPAS